jgi:hypothetical protein
VPIELLVILNPKKWKKIILNQYLFFFSKISHLNFLLYALKYLESTLPETQYKNYGLQWRQKLSLKLLRASPTREIKIDIQKV